MLVFASGFVHSFSMEEQHAVVWFSTVCCQLQLWVAQRKYFWGWNFTCGTFFCTDELFRQNLLRLLQTMQNRKLCTDCEELLVIREYLVFQKDPFKRRRRRSYRVWSCPPLNPWQSSLKSEGVTFLCEGSFYSLAFLPLNNIQTVRRQL